MAQKALKLFFDLDGTLLDVAPRHYRVYAEVIDEFNGRPLNRATYWKLKRQKTKWSELLNLSQLSSNIEHDFLDRFISKIENPEYLAKDQLFPGVLEILNKLIHLGCEEYLISLRRQPKLLQRQVINLGIAQYFTKVLTGHSDNDGYNTKIKLIEPLIRTDKGIIIGDTEADIMTGKKLGLTTIAVLSGIRDKQFLEQFSPDYLIRTIIDIPMIIKGLSGK